MNGKLKAVLVVMGALLYLVCPIDILPDFIPGIGQADDLLVMLFGGKKAINLFSA